MGLDWSEKSDSLWYLTGVSTADSSAAEVFGKFHNDAILLTNIITTARLHKFLW